MKHGADRLARSLEAQGIRTATLHSNRSQNQRLRALKDFKSGAVRVLVATDIAARGIDVDGISHVVNYDFPKHPKDYVHHVGRTGRAQAVGDAFSFVTPEDQKALRSLERFIGRGIVRKHAEGFNHAVPAPSTCRASNDGDTPTQNKLLRCLRWADSMTALLKGGMVHGRPRLSAQRGGGVSIFTLAPEIVLTGPTAALFRGINVC